MPRWLWWAPICLATAVLAILAFRAGWAVVHLTESDVIERYAAHYVSQGGAGARVEHCMASPSDLARVWITLRCAAPGAPAIEYNITRLGTLTQPAAQNGPDI